MSALIDRLRTTLGPEMAGPEHRVNRAMCASISVFVCIARSLRNPIEWSLGSS